LILPNKSGLNKTISIIIVNFNAGNLLTQCVESLLQSSFPIHVLVSDNNSTDDSIRFLNAKIQDSRLHVEENGRNLGFAKASNMVLPIATGEYILFLNPDCIIQPDTLTVMLGEMEKRLDVGMAGCLILNEDGSEQAGCRRRVPTPARSLIRVLRLDIPFPILRGQGLILHQHLLPEDPIDVEAISGAFMLVRRSALEDVGTMDEGYFLHCEDLDWCMRFRQKGWKILFVPHVTAVHHQGTCSDSRPVRVEWHKHKGMIRFYRKFFRHQYPLPLMLVVMISVWVRFVLQSVILTAKRIFT